MEMMLVGSRELSNDMENGHGFLKMLHSFIESITLWQANSPFLTTYHSGTTETSTEIYILEAVHIQRSTKAVATCLIMQKGFNPKLIEENTS